MIRAWHDYIKYSFWCKPEYEEIIDKQIKNSDVLIVGLSFCPWTRRAKELIKSEYKVESVILSPDIISNDYKVNLLYCMCKKTNTINVPQRWVKGKHIGDFEHLWKKHHRKEI